LYVEEAYAEAAATHSLDSLYAEAAATHSLDSLAYFMGDLPTPLCGNVTGARCEAWVNGVQCRAACRRPLHHLTHHHCLRSVHVVPHAIAAETGGSELQLGDIQCAVAVFLQASGSSGKAVVSGENAVVTELSKLVSGLDAKWAVLSEKGNVELLKQVRFELEDTPNVVVVIEDSFLAFERIRCTSSDKVHVIESAEADGHHAEWTTFCGWRFAASKSSGQDYVRGVEQPKQDKDRCVSCHSALVELGEGEVLQIKGVTTAST
jgi:hypothetical protein